MTFSLQTGYFRTEGGVGCEPCGCYYNGAAGGALSLSCDQNTGKCQCKEGVEGLRCDTCENKFAEITPKGCQGEYLRGISDNNFCYHHCHCNY